MRAVEVGSRRQDDRETEGRTLAVFTLNDEALIAGEQPLEKYPIFPACRGHRRKFRELRTADGAAHFDGPDIVARQDEAIGLVEILPGARMQDGIGRKVAYPPMRTHRFR